MKAHLGAREIAALSTGDLSPARSREARDHCATCDRCARMVRLVIAANGLTVPADALFDEAVAELESQPIHRWFALAAEPRFRTPGLARRLTELAVSEIGVDHDRAIAFASVAAEIAEGVFARSPSPEIADLCIDAWKNLSTAQRTAGRYSEALAWLDRAQRYLPQSADREIQGAVLDLARGIILGEEHVWHPSEAERLLANAEAVFVRRGYQERQIQVVASRAIVIAYAGRYSEALPLFERAYAGTEEGAANQGLAAENLAWCLAMLGQFSRADELLDVAEAVLRAEGREIQLARTLAIRGLIMHGRGLYDEGAAVSIEAMERMFNASHSDDAALSAGLDAVRSLVAAERGAMAADLLRRLVSISIRLDREQPSRRHFFTAQAIAYLHDLGRQEMLTPDVVNTVASYVGDLRGSNPVAFVPPFPSIAM